VKALAALVLSIGVLTNPAAALEPEERLSDPVLEERAREISAELRCVVCPNQSIDDSNAPLARDLRRVVRERLADGDSNQAVMAFVTDRYGDFVRLSPPVRPATYALWFGPPLILAAGGAVVAVYLLRRRKSATAPDPLTPEERQRVDELLRRDGEPPA
jgi:cytochrome c-type biogenesis protein CcmH